VELDLVSDTLLARGADSADDEAEQVTALGRAHEQLMPERRLAVRLHLTARHATRSPSSRAGARHERETCCIGDWPT